MAWVRSNFVSGYLTNTLSAGTTSLQSGGLTGLAAVSGGDQAVIVIDPLSVEPEAVVVTAHANSTDSATVLRGQFGTTARMHDPGTLWIHTFLHNEISSLESAVAAVTASTINIVAAKGDLLLGSGANALGRLPAPVSDVVLTGDTTAPTGARWAKVGENQLDTNAVTSAKAASNFLEARHVPNGLITGEKLATAYLPSAGGTLSGQLSVNDNSVVRPHLQDYSEATSVVASVGGTYNLNMETANVFDLTLSANVTFTFSNPPASGRAGSLTVILRQPSTAVTVAWPSTVKWADGSPPEVMDNSEVSVLSFLTRNGGSEWFGFLSGRAFA